MPPEEHTRMLPPYSNQLKRVIYLDLAEFDGFHLIKAGDGS